MALTRKEIERRRLLGRERAKVVHEIVYEMRRHGGYYNAQIADILKCSNPLVSLTIHGKRHSPRVLCFLREIGVPEEYLFDPRKREAA
jgi:predicted transcriptional regulator